MTWFSCSTMFFSFNGAIYPYYFYLQSLNLDFFLSHYNKSISFTGLIYDLNWCKRRIKPFCPSRFHSQRRMSEKQTEWQTHYRVPCYHNKKNPTSLAATWQRVDAFPLAIVSLEMIQCITISRVNVSPDYCCNCWKHSWPHLWLATWLYPCCLCHRRILGLASPDLHYCFPLQADCNLDANRSCVILTKWIQHTLFKKSYPRQVLIMYFLQYFYMNINNTFASLDCDCFYDEYSPIMSSLPVRISSSGVK